MALLDLFDGAFLDRIARGGWPVSSSTPEEKNVTNLFLPSRSSPLHVVDPLDTAPLVIVVGCQLTAIHNLLAGLFTIILVYSQPQPPRRHDPTQTRNSPFLAQSTPEIVSSDQKSREQKEEQGSAFRARVQRRERRAVRPDRLGTAHGGNHRRQRQGDFQAGKHRGAEELERARDENRRLKIFLRRHRQRDRSAQGRPRNFRAPARASRHPHDRRLGHRGRLFRECGRRRKLFTTS